MVFTVYLYQIYIYSMTSLLYFRTKGNAVLYTVNVLLTQTENKSYKILTTGRRFLDYTSVRNTCIDIIDLNSVFSVFAIFFALSYI
jgi:hypothetical protein